MWYYKDKKIETLQDIPENCVGFVYKICKLDEEGNCVKLYIGKKQITSIRKTKISNKEKLETGNNRKKFKTVIKESDWQNYNSSSKELQTEIKELGQKYFKKEIIEFCFNKRDLTFFEVYYQIKYNVLFIDSYNKNILSRFFVGLTKPNY